MAALALVAIVSGLAWFHDRGVNRLAGEPVLHGVPRWTLESEYRLPGRTIGGGGKARIDQVWLAPVPQEHARQQLIDRHHTDYGAPLDPSQSLVGNQFFHWASRDRRADILVGFGPTVGGRTGVSIQVKER